MNASLGWARKPLKGAPTLLCLPYAGGDGGAFRAWLHGLGAGAGLAWAELPGRASHFSAAPLRSIAAQVEWLLPEVRAIAPPLVIFGYSMGALTGYELAHALVEAGNAPPALLMVAAHRAPGHATDREMLHALPEPELVAHLAAFDGTPPEVLEHAELLELIAPRLRADFEACETHRLRARPPLEIPLVVYGGATDREVPPAALLQWAPLTRRQCDFVLLPGHHFFIKSAANLLLDDIARRMPCAAS